MKKILIVTPYPRDANSFWRCMGPMSYLANHSDGEIQMTLSQPQFGVSWSEVSQFDLVFLHRPCRNDDLIVLQIAHNLGIPTWIDYDDWLFDLPIWNPHKDLYDNLTLQTAMAQSIACADVVSVSTAQLHDLFKTINPNVVVLPNAYRSDVFKYRKATIDDRSNLAYWRGTNTHDGDLLSVRDGFHKLKHKIQFIGSPSWLLFSGMDPKYCERRKSMDVLLFNRYLWDLKPKVMVFPLFDCLFNRCKSNIAYIEAIHAGAVCVAPEMPEWKREGVITYPPHDSEMFTQAVNQAFEMSDTYQKRILESAFESMKANYDIAIINELRKQVVEALTSSSYKLNPNNPMDQMHGMKALAYFHGLKNKGGQSEQATEQNRKDAV